MGERAEPPDPCQYVTGSQSGLLPGKKPYNAPIRLFDAAGWIHFVLGNTTKTTSWRIHSAGHLLLVVYARQVLIDGTSARSTDHCTEKSWAECRFMNKKYCGSTNE